VIVDLLGYRDWADSLASQVTPMLGSVGIRVHFHEKADQVCADADIVYLVGWSEIVPPTFYADRMVIVLHPSPLPLYRGGSPIQHQIIDGRDTSAVTLFRLDAEHPAVDSGPICWQEEIDISPPSTLAHILGRIARTGAVGVAQTAIAYRDGTLTFREQRGRETFRYRRTPDQSEITMGDLATLTGRQLYDRIRALQPPYPQAFIVGVDGARVYLNVEEYEVP
jgi:methionyl-tRNA formyltransferase